MNRRPGPTLREDLRWAVTVLRAKIETATSLAAVPALLMLLWAGVIAVLSFIQSPKWIIGIVGLPILVLIPLSSLFYGYYIVRMVFALYQMITSFGQFSVFTDVEGKYKIVESQLGEYQPYISMSKSRVLTFTKIVVGIFTAGPYFMLIWILSKYQVIGTVVKSLPDIGILSPVLRYITFGGVQGALIASLIGKTEAVTIARLILLIPGIVALYLACRGCVQTLESYYQRKILGEQTKLREQIQEYRVLVVISLQWVRSEGLLKDLKEMALQLGMIGIGGFFVGLAIYSFIWSV